MAREPVLAAGGIVLRREEPPRIAVVRLRKRDEWVLPKGKLAGRETPREAAEREVLEETGHDVTVHEFLGTLAYESGGRAKIVHYWRMEADDAPAYELMNDVRGVDWLPLDAAVSRLSRSYERAFLTHVGPHALANAALDAAARRAKAKAVAAKKRRSRQVPAPGLPVEPAPALLEVVGAMEADAPVEALAEREAEPSVVLDETDTSPIETASDEATAPTDQVGAPETDGERPSLAQKVRAWLRRAA